MSEDLVISQCSPTMAGLKTGNLFTCPMEDKKTLNESIRRMNMKLVPRGVRLLPVKYLEKRVLIYMYRPDRLRADLKDAQAISILSEKAYPIDNADKCVAELVRRVNSQETFPHEIGLFLGYPSEDVNGFIKYGADKAKCVGTWRVYGDEEAAKKKFALYKKCTRVYKDAYRRHNSFERLVVNGAR